MRICRRELLRFVAYGLPAWLGLCHLRERNEPNPARLDADSEPPTPVRVQMHGSLGPPTAKVRVTVGSRSAA